MSFKQCSRLSRTLTVPRDLSCRLKAPRPKTQRRLYSSKQSTSWEDRDNLVRYARLKSRSLIKLSGADVIPFLQGLVSADVAKFETREILRSDGSPSLQELKPYYTAFLNAQGRVISDVIIWPGTDEKEPAGTTWYIEVDLENRPILASHLKKHKLRSKVKLENVSEDDLTVHFAWPTSLVGEKKISDIGRDPRADIGVRLLNRPEGGITSNADGFVEVSEDEYKIHRILNGVAEGQDEITSGSALPQESNIDYFGGIDFRKGCYLGQELTIRTHHTGVVRKRILPVQIYDDRNPISKDAKAPDYIPNAGLDLPPSGSNIAKVSSKGRSTGKWLGGIGNVGLALCRLEMMTDIRLTDEPTNYDPDREFKISWEASESRAAGEVKVKAFVPNWMRKGIAAGLKSRERTSKKEEEMEEVD